MRNLVRGLGFKLQWVRISHYLRLLSEAVQLSDHCLCYCVASMLSVPNFFWNLGHADDANSNAKPSSKEEEQMRSERGVQFLIGNSFYRKESAVGRDLGVLAAAVLKKEKGQLRVLDALCGSGVRAARYLAQAQADFVWANDACDSLRPLITHNLSLAATVAAASNFNSQSVVPTSNAKEIESVVCELCSLFSSFNG